jgi:hypothetical protein
MSKLYLRNLFTLSKQIYEHKDLIADVGIRVKLNSDTPCREEVLDIVERLSPGLVDDEYSFSLTRALGEIIGFNGNTSSNPYTSDELRLALSFVLSGGKKIDAINKYGILKRTLYYKLNEIHDLLQVEHGKNGALKMQQLCINDSANVNKALVHVLQKESGFTSLINKYEADVLNRVMYLSGRIGIFLFVTNSYILLLFAI